MNFAQGQVLGLVALLRQARGASGRLHTRVDHPQQGPAACTGAG